MDKVFEEEKQNLQKTEDKIDSLIENHRANYKRIQNELSGFYTVDYNDVDEKRRLRRSSQSELEKVQEYEDYKPSPYFGRLDLESSHNGDKTETYYIGKKGLSVGSDVIITDWRAPIGEFFYAKTEKEFKHNDYLYTLMLRRALQIENAQLLDYNTEFDGDSISLEGDVIDPFLLTVLKDKRRQNRLTDIIKTIQGNQNNIIRKPSNESFVVQGCAGSGKTMILLHRLSYLAYNKRYSSYSHIKIITPNKFFNLHIDDLSSELGLGDVERLTVEEFYVSLIKKYYNKLDVDADVISEKNINEELLTELYSVEFQERLRNNYHLYWDKLITEFEKDDLFDILVKYGNLRMANVEHNISTYELLSTSMNKVLSDYKTNQDKITDRTERIERILSQISDAEGEHKTKTAEIIVSKDKLLSKIAELSSPYDTEIETTKQNIVQIDNQIEELVSNVRELTDTSKKNIELVNEIDSILNSRIDITAINNADIFNYLSVSCKDGIEAIYELNNEKSKIPVYNFARRNKIKKSIQELNDKVGVVAREKLIEYKNHIIEQIDNFSVQDAENQKNLASLKTQKELLVKKINEIELRKSTFTSIKNSFVSDEYPNIKHLLSSKELANCQNLIIEYVQVYTDYTTLTSKIKRLKEQIETTNTEIVEMKNSLPSAGDIECVEKHQSNIVLLAAKSVYKNLFYKEMRALYKNNKVRYTKDNYRHKIYLKLVYCSLYYRRAVGLPTFLNIDEAQDLALAEYKLLKTVLGDSCTYNLYGDVNQLVYSYKGITDWDDINDIISGNIYFLNENYRNTIQITDYCNKEFEAEIFPIGISGKEVQELSIEDSVKYLLDIKQNSPKMRCAIIFRHGVKSIEDRLKEITSTGNTSWYQINDDKISVISVETAKGLEFDAVVVIADQMTPNEKYIAYTRALDELVVVNDEFTPNEIEVYEEDDNAIDDDMIE